MRSTNFKKQKNKGFTLIELAISSAILTVIFGGMTIFGINIIRSYQRDQALKNTIEDARYAIEILNKTIRTSNNVDGSNAANGGDEIFIIDNYTKQGYCYKFNSNKLQRKIGVSSCADGSVAFTDIVGSDSFNDIEVTGYFKIKPTDRVASVPDKKRGFVRTWIELTYPASAQDNFEDDVFRLQSSVSLRDYGYNSP